MSLDFHNFFCYLVLHNTDFCETELCDTQILGRLDLNCSYNNSDNWGNLHTPSAMAYYSNQ